MTDETEEDHPAWVRLKAMYARGDLDKIDLALKLLDGVLALGSAGSILARFLTWCAVIGAAYLAITGQLNDWIRSIR